MDAEIRDRVEAFVDDLTQLIRAAAVEAVQMALTGEQAPAGRQARGGRSTKRKAAAPRKATAGKRIRRTAEQVEKLGARILAHVKQNPGQRLGDIAKALQVATKDARRPAFAHVDAGTLRTEGQRGGTRYFAGGRAAAKPAAKKKATKRKATKKKAAKRATKKRKVSK